MGKAVDILKSRGISGFLQQGQHTIFSTINAYSMLRPQPSFDDVDSLLDFSGQVGGGMISPMQVRSEIKPLLEMVRGMRPRTVLEIGTARGGTLFLWTRVVAENAHLISIDLPGGAFGGGYAWWRKPVYQSFATSKQKLDLLRGNSHSMDALTRIRKLLDGEPVDLLFIDAGHTYDDVQQDFSMYSPLVRPGGLIVFHDIAEHPKEKNCDVYRFWSEIKQQYDSGEFIEDPHQGWAGIGYLRWQTPVAANAS
ncbi:MAG TPA: class I SAM-dependent methyltransferase [Pseudacidobacterium sp.]|jgi:predicted O-methyltransferase YrrM|nr:class I SAM-dependent methyltransferase [Pseudacidobacterium sp.]